MLTYWIGLALIVGLFSAGPLIRKRSHAKLLADLKVDGVRVTPRLWGLNGLRCERSHWQGNVRFKLPDFAGGGRQGHLVLTANVGASAPSLLMFERGRIDEASLGDRICRTGDAEFDGSFVVAGDRPFAERLLDAEMRRSLRELSAVGGRLWSVDGGIAEITGPLPRSVDPLRKFMELSTGILDRIAAAAKEIP